MKDLPKIYHNSENKKYNNNEEVFYSNNNDIIPPNTNINQKINDIFSSPNYVYKATVDITLKDKTVTKRIIGRNKNYIITMDNELIPIENIIDINSVKK